MRKISLPTLALLLFTAMAGLARAEESAGMLIYSNPAGMQMVEDTAAYHQPKRFPGFKLLRADNPLAAAPKTHYLILIGAADGFPLIQEKLAAFPVRITDTGFTLAGKKYSRAAGLILSYETPEGRTDLRTGKHWSAPWYAIGIASATGTYRVTASNRLLREGLLVKTSSGFELDTSSDTVYASDPRQDFDDSAVVKSTSGIAFHYQPGSRADREIGKLMEQTAAIFAELKDYFNSPGFGKPVNYYLYETRAEKTAVSGQSGNANADVDPDNPEVHAIFSKELNATGKHEFVHIFSYQKFGMPGSRLMDEGMCVALGGNWNGKSFPDCATALMAENKLPSLSTLINDMGYWYGNSGDAYSMAGHFVNFLLKTYGREKTETLFPLKLTDANVSKVLGINLAELERLWQDSMKAGTGNK